MNTIEDMLRKDPHIVKIIPGEKWEFGEIDYERISPHNREWARRSIEIIKKDLAHAYIVDDFASHEERKPWILSLPEKLYSYILGNPLRGNVRTSLFNKVLMMSRSYSASDKEKFSKIACLVIDLRDQFSKYDERTVTEKLELTRELKRRVYDVLKYLTISGDNKDEQKT